MTTVCLCVCDFGQQCWLLVPEEEEKVSPVKRVTLIKISKTERERRGMRAPIEMNGARCLSSRLLLLWSVALFTTTDSSEVFPAVSVCWLPLFQSGATLLLLLLLWSPTLKEASREVLLACTSFSGCFFSLVLSPCVHAILSTCLSLLLVSGAE